MKPSKQQPKKQVYEHVTLLNDDELVRIYYQAKTVSIAFSNRLLINNVTYDTLKLLLFKLARARRSLANNGKPTKPILWTKTKLALLKMLTLKGKTDRQIAKRLHCSTTTLCKTRTARLRLKRLQHVTWEERIK